MHEIIINMHINNNISHTKWDPDVCIVREKVHLEF